MKETHLKITSTDLPGDNTTNVDFRVAFAIRQAAPELSDPDTFIWRRSPDESDPIEIQSSQRIVYAFSGRRVRGFGGDPLQFAVNQPDLTVTQLGEGQFAVAYNEVLIPDKAVRPATIKRELRRPTTTPNNPLIDMPN